MRTVLIRAIVAASALLVGACGAQVREPGGGAASGATITAAELGQRIRSGPAPYILDVRTREEFESGHIPGAVNISHDELPARLAEITAAKDEEVVVYCRTGRRALIAEDALRKEGFTNVRDLRGSIQAWTAAGLPVQ